ncbi:MAG: VOC family protein [Nocardioides sp.]
MSVFISHTTVDCHDAFALSEWWREVLGYEMEPDDLNEPGDVECAIRDAETGHTVLFIEVPDAVLPAKRIHFDVRPRVRSRDDEVESLLARGARQVADHRGVRGPGTGWVVMADPEGNELCVLRSVAEIS